MVKQFFGHWVADESFFVVWRASLLQPVHNKSVGDVLAPFLIIGMASGATAAAIAVGLFGAGLLAAFLIYSFGGAAVTLAVAWFRFRCVERREADESDHGSVVRRAVI